MANPHRLISVAFALTVGCGGDDTGTGADGPTDSGADGSSGGGDAGLSLANCGGTVGNGVAAFYQQYFACSDIEAMGTGTRIATDGLPPHPSAYYPENDPNWVEFDDRGGTHNLNPGQIGAGNFQFVIPSDPMPKGITIDGALVDNRQNTNDEEYSLGAVGIALDGVVIFAAMAAGDDDLAEEQFTFDLYEGHPAGADYHYHFNTPGPLEVLEDRGVSNSSTPGSGSVELYGIMCDGAVVMGCTELDGSAPNDSDFDAQNGHVHDMTDGQTVHFTMRYHTHVCPSQWPAYPFFPEIAFYDEGPCGGGP